MHKKDWGEKRSLKKKKKKVQGGQCQPVLEHKGMEIGEGRYIRKPSLWVLVLTLQPRPQPQGPSSKRTYLLLGDNSGTRLGLLVLKDITGVLPVSIYTGGNQGQGGLSLRPGFCGQFRSRRPRFPFQSQFQFRAFCLHHCCQQPLGNLNS